MPHAHLPTTQTWISLFQLPGGEEGLVTFEHYLGYVYHYVIIF